MMTDDTDMAKCKIIDFGLSKMIGPGQKSFEQYGTIGFCAPEVL
jgi:serine/threonine protein kinase